MMARVAGIDPHEVKIGMAVTADIQEVEGTRAIVFQPARGIKMAHALRAKTACIGLGMAGMGEAPGKNAMDLMVEVTYLAAKDAGISVQDIDGVFSATAVHSMPACSGRTYRGSAEIF